MNKLPIEKRRQILHSLVEGNSLRATSRMVDVSLNTVTKLLLEVGSACSRYQDEVMRNLPCQRLQVDEIWCFCGMKERQVPAEMRGTDGLGDVWTWTAIDADTKLVPTWHVGKRTLDDARTFVGDVEGRLANRIQLTSDGLKVYVQAVREVFGRDIDYGVLAKQYGKDPSADHKYTPAICTSCTRRVVAGNPDEEHISTSFVERQNLTMRMGMRRFTRLTNAFSKRIRNLGCAVALHFMHYNFIRRHQTLGMTPAEAAGVGRVWKLDELPGMADFICGRNPN